MSELTEWIKYELYPSLFEVIPQALPEFEFKRIGRPLLIRERAIKEFLGGN